MQMSKISCQHAAPQIWHCQCAISCVQMNFFAFGMSTQFCILNGLSLQGFFQFELDFTHDFAQTAT